MHDLIKYTALSSYANTKIVESERFDLSRKEFIYLRWCYVLEDYSKRKGFNYSGLLSSMGVTYGTAKKWLDMLINKGLVYKSRKQTFNGSEGFCAYFQLTTKGRVLLSDCFQYLHEHEHERIKKITRPKRTQKNPII